MSRSLLLAMTLLARVLAAQERGHPAGSVGAVRFETSCASGTRQTFNDAVAHLYSFDFPDAVKAFNAVLTSDSTCVMAYWGLALSAWGNPFAAGLKPEPQLQRGLAAVEHGRSTAAGTERERAWLAAAGQLYVDYAKKDQRQRVAAYRDAMAAVAAKYPRDDEAQVFHALTLAISADPSDTSYRSLRKAGEILQRLARKHPNHPGIAHYLIHSYDVPRLAGRALPAANKYAAIAPASAHALHMPSHTYTRVGDWEKSIASNIKSAKAAAEEKSYAEALHASDYLMYAYLQTGQDTAAARLLRDLPSLAERFDPTVIGTGAPPAAGFFAMAAIPARYALERGEWKAAASLPVRRSAFPFTDAITWFARGVGGARSNDTEKAAESVRQLQQLRQQLADRGEAYWSNQVEIQRRGVEAWLMWARGDREGALAAMRATAEMEAKTEKNAITPGPILPAREQLAEMLLAAGNAVGAFKEFELALANEPGRFRSMAGAMRAASTAHIPGRAQRYARELVRLCERGDRPGRADLVAARSITRP